MNSVKKITIVPLIILFTLLTGCTSWEKPGANQYERDRDYAECKALGYSQLPSDWTSEVVHSFETKRFSCKNEDKEEDKSCNHYVTVPKTEVNRWDKNESSRRWVISSCMYKKGWHEETRYWF
ncbi:hypothetical protein LGZ99_09905 [Photorhabdus temperata]|uniref:Lipoprotein n=2 Tax=Photorhabdus temperata TaxID=574560 RepID=A0A081RWW9_PHOTE|nr:hypothetical protein [Photorhabdus temperata]ERT13254.1 hypothetical protein O185_09875 [Photorhabdus temperata J3]KER03172.1 hypothetical protein MEG1DRAFT_02183 [Photorhabdus temperata subsp. temperata Meg1]MCT8347517.1 hypothetical protein [Photorhabdus temperata]